MKIIFTAFIFLVSNFYTISQDIIERNKNAIYAEFVGQAPLVSLNYERLIWQNHNVFLNSRVGFGYAILSLSGVAGLALNIGERYNYFETGLATGIVDNGHIFRSNYDVFLSPSLGFKRVAPKGLFIKVYVSPLFFPKCIFEYSERSSFCSQVLPLGGFGIGSNF